MAVDFGPSMAGMSYFGLDHGSVPGFPGQRTHLAYASCLRNK
jgi:hypothetical protein